MDASKLDLLHQLEELEQEHEELNNTLDDKNCASQLDEVTVLRIKKRKLALKDQITKLKSILHPDIIA